MHRSYHFNEFVPQMSQISYVDSPRARSRQQAVPGLFLKYEYIPQPNNPICHSKFQRGPEETLKIVSANRTIVPLPTPPVEKFAIHQYTRPRNSSAANPGGSQKPKIVNRGRDLTKSVTKFHDSTVEKIKQATMQII